MSLSDAVHVGADVCVSVAANGKLITTIAAATAKDVDLAVKAAENAFKQSWGLKVDGTARGALIDKLASLIEKNADELAAIESIDCGTYASVVLRNPGSQLTGHLKARSSCLPGT